MPEKFIIDKVDNGMGYAQGRTASGKVREFQLVVTAGGGELSLNVEPRYTYKDNDAWWEDSGPWLREELA